MNSSLRIAIIGAGWAGMTAAVQAVKLGHQVTVYEAARTLGGRARGVPLNLPDGREVRLDNGQHILIGAYTECLRLMDETGVDVHTALMRRPLAMMYPDGSGLALPDGPAPLDVLAGVLTARGWSLRDKWALLRTALRWQRTGFACDAHTSVAELCAALPARLREEFIEPLCVSALNTPMPQASGQIFLRVLRDALLGPRGSSHMLLPRTDLGSLFPGAAARWLLERGAQVLTGQRIDALHWQAPHWQLESRTCTAQAFDRVILATCASNALQTLVQSAQKATPPIAEHLRAWCHGTAQLTHRAITTIYAQAAPRPGAAPKDALLRAPMLALRANATQGAPAQFVFDHDAIARPTQPTHLLTFVISDSSGDRASLQAAVTAQAAQQLDLAITPVLTITEKRATFACTPALARPPMHIANGLLVCGDYIDGPYPATLEGAVRSGQQAVKALR